MQVTLNTSTPKRLRSVLCLSDFETAARKHLPKPIMEYIAGAAEDNNTFQENRRIFSDYSFKTRVLVDVSRRNQTIKLFGAEYDVPFGIAPMGINALSAYRGDLVLSTVAQRRKMISVMSGSSLIRMEQVLESAPSTWFQAYLPGDLGRIEALIKRIAAARVETLVLTVDIPVAANRENNIRAGFSTPLKPSLNLAWEGISHPRWLIGTFLKTLISHGMPHFENSFAERGAPILSANVLRDFSSRDHLNWSHIAHIRRLWKGPLVIKGILNVQDSRLAKSHGADAIILSNHGGRQLDGAVSPMQILEQVVNDSGDWPVLVDSGFRRGSDVLKALCLGARAVFIGRLFNFAAAIAGELGVDHAFVLLRDEIDRNMAMLGVNNCSELNSELLTRNDFT
jgi:L-lactate dehydrogenase (cytochrome)